MTNTIKHSSNVHADFRCSISGISRAAELIFKRTSRCIAACKHTPYVIRNLFNSPAVSPVSPSRSSGNGNLQRFPFHIRSCAPRDSGQFLSTAVSPLRPASGRLKMEKLRLPHLSAPRLHPRALISLFRSRPRRPFSPVSLVLTFPLSVHTDARRVPSSTPTNFTSSFQLISSPPASLNQILTRAFLSASQVYM